MAIELLAKIRISTYMAVELLAEVQKQGLPLLRVTADEEPLA